MAVAKLSSGGCLSNSKVFYISEPKAKENAQKQAIKLMEEMAKQ